ncbi:MAG: cobalamin-binding protein, partial [Deltaproteobacteria bacterium]|nr:cobalamin-binding protein [Deltaproteobacteria bacterium]
MGATETRRRFTRLAVLLAAAACLAATPDTRTLTDDLGRRVTAPPHPARILSYAPNLTETVFAIGAADRLVGRTRFCDWPPEVSKVPSFGGLLDPDFEKIAVLRPDLILATTAGDPRDKVDALSRLGYPVFVTSPEDVGDVIADIEAIGAAVGAERDATRVAAGMRAELADVARRVAGRPRVRTLVVIWQDPLRTIGNGSFLADVLHRAGGEPVPGGGDADYPQVNMEAVLHAAPEVILLGRPGEPGRGEESFWRQFKTLPAVRDGRILSVDLEVASRPGPRIAGAVRE